MKSLPPGATPHFTTNIQSHSAISVAVVWERLKGNSDAGTNKGSLQWPHEHTTKPTAAAAAAAPADAAAAANARSSSSLASPLASVVSSQIEFIKLALRCHTAHVCVHVPDLPPHLRVKHTLFNRCCGCPKTATVLGCAATTECEAPFLLIPHNAFAINAPPVSPSVADATAGITQSV